MKLIENIKDKIDDFKQRHTEKTEEKASMDLDGLDDVKPKKGLSRTRRILMTIFVVLVVGGLVAGTVRTVVVNNEVEKFRKVASDPREADFSPKDVDDLSDAAVNKLVKEAVEWDFVSKDDAKKLTDKEKRNVAKAYGSTLAKGPANYTNNERRHMGNSAIKAANDKDSKVKDRLEKVEIESFLVQFKDYDDSLLATRIYKDGAQLTLPQNPKREADDEYTYKFKEWEPAVKAVVKEDATYTAVYIATDIETGEEIVVTPTPTPAEEDKKKQDDKTKKDDSSVADDITKKIDEVKDKITGKDEEKQHFEPTEEIKKAGSTTVAESSDKNGKKDAKSPSDDSNLTKKAVQVKDVVLKNDLTEKYPDVVTKVNNSKGNIKMVSDPESDMRYYIIDKETGDKLATLKFLDLPETAFMSTNASDISKAVKNDKVSIPGMTEDETKKAVAAISEKFTGSEKDGQSPYALYTTTPAFGAKDVYYAGGNAPSWKDADGNFAISGAIDYIGSEIDGLADEIAIYVKTIIAGALILIVMAISVIGYLIMAVLGFLFFLWMFPFFFSLMMHN